MSNEQAYIRILNASAKLQWNMAMILEAKALEAEKIRSWLCNHVTADSFGDHQELLKETVGVHEQLIEVIDGVTKLGQGLTNTLKAVLKSDADSSSGGMGGLGGMFGGGFDMEDK